MPSIAEETRRAVDRTPHVRRALREGILNYTAAARRLDVEADPEAVASALRRYETELPPIAEPTERRVRVRMERRPDPELLTVAGREPDTEALAAIRLSGLTDREFVPVASALGTADLTLAGVGYVETEGVFLVDRRDGSDALRLVEGALSETRSN